MFANSRSSQGGHEQSLLPAVRAALQGVAAYVEKDDAADYQQFRARMQTIVTAVNEREDPAEVLANVQTATSALREYSQRSQRSRQEQDAELRGIIKVLLDTLVDLSIARPQTMQRMSEIGTQILTSKSTEEVHQGKAELEQCLADIHREAECHGPAAGHEAVDPVTGLDGRPSAESTLTAACAAEGVSCAVVLLVDRLDLYNRRYGREVGDKVLHFFAEFVSHAFDVRDTLFRWTGPALLMLREGPLDKIQAEVRRVLEPRLQFDVDTASRTILLSIDACWTVLPMMVDPRLLINKIDGFVTY